MEGTGGRRNQRFEDVRKLENQKDLGEIKVREALIFIFFWGLSPSLSPSLALGEACFRQKRKQGWASYDALSPLEVGFCKAQ